MYENHTWNKVKYNFLFSPFWCIIPTPFLYLSLSLREKQHGLWRRWQMHSPSGQRLRWNESYCKGVFSACTANEFCNHLLFLFKAHPAREEGTPTSLCSSPRCQLTDCSINSSRRRLNFPEVVNWSGVFNVNHENWESVWMCVWLSRLNYNPAHTHA